MQVTETLSEGLKREFSVVVPAAELEAKVTTRLDELKDRVRINGFRPGKVPVAHLKKVYGRSAMAEVIEATVRDTNSQIVTDRGFKLAAEPKVTLPTEQGRGREADQRSERSELHRRRSKSCRRSSLPISRPSSSRSWWPTSATPKSTKPSPASPSRTGLMRPRRKARRPRAATASTSPSSAPSTATPFEGGTGDDIAVQIGSNTFIPGFEEQLIGIGVGENRTVKATFPTQYANEALAGKEAEFAVTAKSIEAPGEVKVDDEFAKSLGLELLAKLRDAVKDRLARDQQAMSRQKLKRALLDELDKLHQFDPPPSMVEEEFNRVWVSVTDELKNENKTFADENTTEEKAKEEYHGIAARRVRLGLVLAEIGEKNNITVTDEELSRAVAERARQFAGQEQRVWDYFRQNPEAVASLRAPIFEEKVVDFLLELADVTDKKVSREELFKEEEEEAA